MSTKAAALVAVVALAFGAGLGWLLRGEPKAATPAVLDLGTEVSTDSEEPTLTANADFAAQRIAELEGQLIKVNAEASAEVEALKKIIADAGLKPGAPDDEAARIAKAIQLQGPRFEYEGMEALKEIKWDTIAKAVVGMGPQMDALGKALAAGKGAGDLPMKIQKHNVPLIQAAVAASQGGLPGHGINGAFTHPALVANMIFSTLIEAGQPLDDAQVEKLNQLADTYVAEDARLRAGAAAGEETWALAQLVLESEIKDRFYMAVDSILTPAQIDILHPPTLRDRLSGDIFSAGLIWMQTAQVGRAKDRQDLQEKITAGLMRQFQVPEEEREAVAGPIGDWANQFGDEAFTPLDPLEKSNMVKMERVRRAGRPMIELYKALVRNLPGHKDVTDRIRSSTFLVIPAGQ